MNPTLRLVVNLVESFAAHDINEPEPSTASIRDAIIDFAGTHDLDLQDTATLFRIASGENTDIIVEVAP